MIDRLLKKLNDI